MMKSGYLTIDEQQHDDKQSMMRSNIANRKGQACAIFLAGACVAIVLYHVRCAAGGFVWNRLSGGAGTFARGGGRDFSVDFNHGTISPKGHPEFVLGADPVPSLVLVKKGSADQLVFGDLEQRQSKGQSMALATSTHKVVFKSLTTEGVNGPWRYKETCVVESNQQAAAVRVTLVEDNFLQVEGEDLVLDVAYWNMEEGNGVNFVGGTSSEDKTLMKDGGRDWVLNEDGTIATKSNPDLVLGIAKPRMILVGKGSKDQLVFDQLLINGEQQLIVNEKGVVYIPLTLQSHQGMAVGKKYTQTKRAGEWDYIESAIVPREEALIVQYVDSNFLKLNGEDLVLDVSYWKMFAGNTVNFVGAAAKTDSPQDQGKADNLRKTPPLPSTPMEHENDNGIDSPETHHPSEDSPLTDEKEKVENDNLRQIPPPPSTLLEAPEAHDENKRESSDEDIMVLEGFCNRMPMIGSQGNEGRDYVILGPHKSWKSDAPVFLKIDGFEEGRSVAKETYDYMSRGWALSDGMFDGTVQLSNGDQVPVKTHVTTVW